MRSSDFFLRRRPLILLDRKTQLDGRPASWRLTDRKIALMDGHDLKNDGKAEPNAFRSGAAPSKWLEQSIMFAESQSTAGVDDTHTRRRRDLHEDGGLRPGMMHGIPDQVGQCNRYGGFRAEHPH